MEEYEYEVEIEIAVISKLRYRVVLTGAYADDVIAKAYMLKSDDVRKGEHLSKHDEIKQTINVLGTSRKKPNE